ncbi:DUF819 family protein [Flagellimonas nanhaiensis]|uniref:DUF819 family protein n=1 Tax=Flagellimonas nanhaiensis TaxID=2292706 RepID=A0A371JLT0_9FLAO|nr:DUF819 family protein [Allomuricauda nanhaiensis]RDY58028.1 DUF819 family protein [Allomuricauda nanhaiensis]
MILETDFTPWFISIGTILFVIYLNRLENRYIKSILDWFPAILFAYVIPAVVNKTFGFDFSGHAIHDFSKNYLIPLAIVAVMASLSIAQLKAMGWRPIALFVSGSVWIAIFPVVFIWLKGESFLVTEVLGNQEYWKGVPPIVGGWIGGSTSQLVLKELVECPEGIFLNILVIDNIMVNIWTILMFQGIKRTDLVNKKLGISDDKKPRSIDMTMGKQIKPIWVVAILLICVLIINAITDNLVYKIILLSIIGMGLGNYLKNWPFQFILKLGGVLIVAVMAVLGLKLKFDLIQISSALVWFLVVWLIGHFLFMLLISKILNVNSVWVPIASMANVGGIATAPAVTAAYEKKWMPHAILLAVLSMATGTFWGMITIFFLQKLFTG